MDSSKRKWALVFVAFAVFLVSVMLVTSLMSSASLEDGQDSSQQAPDVAGDHIFAADNNNASTVHDNGRDSSRREPVKIPDTQPQATDSGAGVPPVAGEETVEGLLTAFGEILYGKKQLPETARVELLTVALESVMQVSVQNNRFELHFKTAGHYVIRLTCKGMRFDYRAALADQTVVTLVVPDGECVLKGTVYAGGAPLAGVELQAQRLSGPKITQPLVGKVKGGEVREQAELFTVSDDSGNYSMYGLRPGDYGLLAWRNGFAAVVPVVEGDNLFNIELANAGIEGRVFSGYDGSLLLNARIYLTRRITGQEPKELQDLLYNSPARSPMFQPWDGQNFSIHHLVPGSYSLMVLADGYAAFTVDVELSNPNDVRYLEIPMYVGAVLVLTVNGTDGLAKQPAFLARNLKTGKGMVYTVSGTLDAHEYTDFYPGEYVVAAVAPGHRVAFQTVRLESGLTTTVALELPPAKKMCFTVTDGDGKFVDDVTVQLRLESAGASDVIAEIIAPLLSTGKKGVLACDNGMLVLDTLPNGSYKLVAWKEGYYATEQDLQISDSFYQQVDIRLAKK